MDGCHLTACLLCIAGRGGRGGRRASLGERDASLHPLADSASVKQEVGEQEVKPQEAAPHKSDLDAAAGGAAITGEAQPLEGLEEGASELPALEAFGDTPAGRGRARGDSYIHTYILTYIHTRTHTYTHTYHIVLAWWPVSGCLCIGQQYGLSPAALATASTCCVCKACADCYPCMCDSPWAGAEKHSRTRQLHVASHACCMCTAP